MRRDTSLLLYAPIHILDDPPPFLEWRTFLMDGIFLNEKTNDNIRISYSPKYKHPKKEYILYKKKTKKKPVVKSQLCFVRGLTLQRKTPA